MYTFEVDHGSSAAHNFELYNGSTIDVHGSSGASLAHLYISANSLAGNPTAASPVFVPEARLDNLTGAKINVHDKGVISSLGAAVNIYMAGGNGGGMNIESGGYFVIGGGLVIGPSSVLRGTGPKVLVTGSSGLTKSHLSTQTIDIVNNGTGGNYNSGQLVATAGAQVDADVQVTIWSNREEAAGFNELEVKDGANVWCGAVAMANSALVSGYAKIKIDGGFINLSGAGTAMFVGDGYTRAIVDLGPATGGITSTGGTVYKEFGGDITNVGVCPTVVTAPSLLFPSIFPRC